MLKNLKQKHISEKCPPLFQIHPTKRLHTQARFTDNTRIYHIHTWQRVKHGERHKSGDRRTFLTTSFHQSAAAESPMDGQADGESSSFLFYYTVTWVQSFSDRKRRARESISTAAPVVCSCVFVCPAVLARQRSVITAAGLCMHRWGASPEGRKSAKKTNFDHLWWILQNCIAAISICL